MEDAAIDDFCRDGYILVRAAFDAEVAAACRDRIWDALATHGIDRADRSSWTRPAVRIPCPDGPSFQRAAAAPALHAAYDALVGIGRWTRPRTVGGLLSVKFPSEEWSADTGFHIEGSYAAPPGADGDDRYWANVWSRGRGLLALFLFSDVGHDDAPTRLVVGSHHFIPPVLAEAGEEGMGGEEAVGRLQPSVLARTTAHATGAAGDVYLCHPFLVHTATWPHRGIEPRMVAQPALHVSDGFRIDGSDESPVARVIADALAPAGASAGEREDRNG